SSCSSSCSEKGNDNSNDKESMIEKLNDLSSVKKVIGIVSGKGGVGKSLVTSSLAVTLNRRGYKTAVLDADITGPSIPKAFGVKDKVGGSELGMFPPKSKTGIDIMSINLMLPSETSPVIWRGPVIAGAVKQFWTDVIWKDIDFMFVDMPPGTGDVPLTVFQSIPLDGIIIVTSPQELVSMIVSKAVNMAKMMDIPILGIVENMSYFKCPDCGKELKIFGESNVDVVAKENCTKVLDKIPIDPDLAKCVDTGTIELFVGDYVDNAGDTVEELLK
ncbi:MAG: P-loop NTPase, partial [Acutalibacteraceae bacterium]